jgi:TolB-like protein
VLETDDGLASDGVNIAARIHQLAAPGEIVVTQAARDLVGNRLPLSFRDIGCPTLKNIERQMRLFIVEPQRDEGRLLVRPHLEWSSRPTIAVLPFRTIGAGGDERYFGESITEDIIAGLSRSRSMFVIARSSTLRFSDDVDDPRAVGAALGVKYVLTGTVRRRSDQLRFTIELVDVDQMRAVWSDQFDGAAGDLFDFQDRIVGSILARLELNVQEVETARIGARATESLDAYDCILRAMWHIHRFTPDDYREARRLIDRALSLDPGFARAHAYSAWLLNFWVGEGYSTDPAADRATAVEEARTAASLDPADPFCLAVRGHIMAFLECDPAAGVEILDHVLAIDPNAPLAWGLSANAHAYLGNGDETRERLRNVWRLSPFDPLNFVFWTAAGIGEFVSGRLEESAAWLRMACRAKPRYLGSLRILCATLALSDREDEARKAAAEILEVDPDFRVEQFVSTYALRRPGDRTLLEAGLKRAGLPP